MNWSRLRSLLLFSLFLPQVSIAAPALETLNYVRFYSANDPRVSYACENTNGSRCDGSVVVPNTNWTLNYLAQGSSTFGVLKNMAQLTMTGDDSLGGFPSFVSVGSRSGYRDRYTVTGGSGQGMAEFKFAVSGTTEYSDNAFGNALFQYVPVVNGQADWGHVSSFDVFDGQSTVSVPITFGQAFEGIIYFYALAQVFDFSDQAFANADFSHTAILSGIDVLDQQGQSVAFDITADSGTAYGPSGVAPEPSTAFLLAAAIAGMALVRRRRGA